MLDDMFDGLFGPHEARKKQDWEEIVLLISHDVAHAGGNLLQHSWRPGKVRQRVNVWVNGLGGLFIDLVWSCMMSVVLLFPPIHAEALHLRVSPLNTS